MRLAALLVAIASVAAASGCGADTDITRPRHTVVWRADAELPTDREWASSRAAANDGSCDPATPPDTASPRIRRDRQHVAKGDYSYAITAEPGDDCDGERAELGQGNPTRPGFDDRLFREGEERYISWQIMLGPDFDPQVDTWRVVTQLHQAGGYGTPALSLNVEDGELILYKSDENEVGDGTVALWRAPAVTGRWIRLTLRVKFSPDPATGFVELWGNPAGGDVVRLLDRTPTYTMKRDESGRALPNHARIGIYRNPNGPFGTETVYYDGFTVATTRAAAEASAF